ncbi:unnamed protein product [Adineta ricciae]|uniref:Uncharacterized protein n=1 Tax=Adineta ricciae TaxID=249248 RepID=A0A814B791_ADIRI|nr:unnamed protein product [Adineta ricciae]CAF0936543.1 unnamed protein product [Adineta ricciae]
MSTINTNVNNDSQPSTTTAAAAPSPPHIPLPATPSVKRLRQILTSEKCRIIADKLLELEQINSTELLVNREINRLNYKRQYIQNLLSLVHQMKATRPAAHSRPRPRRLQKN